MKRIFSIFAIAGVGLVASCNTAADKQQEAALQAQQRTIDSMKIEMAKKQVMDSMSEIAQMQVVVPQMITPVVQQPKATVRKHRSTARRTTTRRAPAVRETASTNNVYTGNSNTQPVAQTQPVIYQEPTAPVQQQKKGWSAKAKGAVIGAGAGAIGGAVINKDNRAKGAILGGIIGAAGGLGVGAIIDKKNGR